MTMTVKRSVQSQSIPPLQDLVFDLCKLLVTKGVLLVGWDLVVLLVVDGRDLVRASVLLALVLVACF